MNKLFLVILLICSFMGEAQEKHQFSLGAGYGDYDLEEEFTSIDFFGWNAGHYSIGYGYQLLDNWMIELDYYDVEKGNVFDNRIIAVSARKLFDLSLRNQAFIKAGANHYDYSLKGDFKNTNETGVGYAIGLGWQYNFDMGLSLGIEVNKMNHSGIESTIVDYSMSYRFY